MKKIELMIYLISGTNKCEGDGTVDRMVLSGAAANGFYTLKKIWWRRGKICVVTNRRR